MDRVSGAIRPMVARATILATGGCGKVYLYTTNPDIATGDGLAMAYRAGAPVANLEFVQFHPTCLYHPEAKSFLLSEALRGEGAMLRTLDGERFMPGVHPQAELAPRDVVARAIDREMKRRGEPYVLLDITHVPAAEPWQAAGTRPPLETVVFGHNWDSVRRVMWDLVGIVRTDQRLAFAARRLALLREEIEEDYRSLRLSRDLIELRNIALVG